MDHNQLTTFDRIVREGSFSRAARELHIAQPTISARIHALEEEVGGALLTRTNHGVQLTALGVSSPACVARVGPRRSSVSAPFS